MYSHFILTEIMLCYCLLIKIVIQWYTGNLKAFSLLISCSIWDDICIHFVSLKFSPEINKMIQIFTKISVLRDT